MWCLQATGRLQAIQAANSMSHRIVVMRLYKKSRPKMRSMPLGRGWPVAAGRVKQGCCCGCR